MITFSKASISYADAFTLSIDDLYIPQGSVLPVIGKNGSGKSTLLRSISRHIPSVGIKTQGSIIYQPQKPYIFQTTCENNLLSVMPDPDKAQAEILLAATGLSGWKLRKTTGMSGGERARLALARTMSVPAEIYLIDEPFASVDEASIASLADMIAGHCRTIKATLLMPMHNFALAAHISDQVLLIHGGTASVHPIKVARDIYQSEILEGNGLC
ncbi:MAG: ATP-binding cassette domain-containing protein [Saccharofermentanales bacterium]